MSSLSFVNECFTISMFSFSTAKFCIKISFNDMILNVIERYDFEFD